MNTLSVLVVAFLGQVCDSSPTYILPYSPPSVYVQLESPIYTYIHYSGTVYSKQYVNAILPGKRMQVPVINGIAPSIDARRVDGSEVYDFTYDPKNKWSGQSPIDYVMPVSLPVTSRSPDPVLPLPSKKVPAPSFEDELKVIQARQNLKDEENAATIKRLEENVAKLQSTIQKMQQLPVTPTPDVAPNPEPTEPELDSGMRKPSEIMPKGI
jgi:hypothetical protein